MQRKSFSANLLQSSKEITLSSELFQGRRAVRAYSFDDITTKDMDDSVFIHKTPEGYRVEVSVSDVDALIPIGSDLDIEAYTRLRSFYGAVGTNHMLPRRLSVNLLSLLPEKNRLTKTITLEFDDDANFLGGTIELTNHTSIKRHDYISASTEIYNRRSPLSEWFAFTLKLAAKNKETFDQSKDVHIDRLGRKFKYEHNVAAAQFMIQELMVATNCFVADYAKEHNLPFLYRIHKKSSSGTISSGYSLTPDSHEAMGLGTYCHFTSPIRRYADLVCHRIITAHLLGQSCPYTTSDLQAIADNLNENRSSNKEIKFQAEREIKLRKHRKLIAKSISSDFESMPATELSDLLVSALKIDSMTNEFHEVLVCRYSELGEKAKGRTLFYTGELDLKELKCKIATSSTAPLCTTLLHLAPKLYPDKITELHFHRTQEKSLTTYRISLVIGNKEYTTSRTATSHKEKDAKQTAAKNFLEDFVQDRCLILARTGQELGPSI